MPQIPDGYSVIPGSGREVAQAIVKAVEAAGGSHGDVMLSPTVGFVVPDEVAKKYKAPKIDEDEQVDDNAPASATDTIEPPEESTGFATSDADEKPAETPKKKSSAKAE